jgi:hypothetical protein
VSNAVLEKGRLHARNRLHVPPAVTLLCPFPYLQIDPLCVGLRQHVPVFLLIDPAHYRTLSPRKHFVGERRRFEIVSHGLIQACNCKGRVWWVQSRQLGMGKGSWAFTLIPWGPILFPLAGEARTSHESPTISMVDTQPKYETRRQTTKAYNHTYAFKLRVSSASQHQFLHAQSLCRAYNMTKYPSCL